MKKILLVDNDPVLRLAGKRLLEGRLQCSVLLAVSGGEAVKMAARERPDLIILDVLMPGLDGVETLKRLRAQQSRAPVIFLTAKEDTADLYAVDDHGVAAIVRKPFDADKLAEQVASLLGADARS